MQQYHVFIAINAAFMGINVTFIRINVAFIMINPTFISGKKWLKTGVFTPFLPCFRGCFCMFLNYCKLLCIYCDKCSINRINTVLIG